VEKRCRALRWKRQIRVYHFVLKIPSQNIMSFLNIILRREL
jgi:hypothetical protein